MKMKTRIIGLTVLLFGLGLSLWTACDKIPDDEMRIGPEKLAPYDPDEDAPIVDTLQYIVLEDFTGVKCPNCPAAATIAHTLQAQYRNQMILIELHPEKVSMTAPHSGDVDLRNAAAKTYFDYWKGTSLPLGLVNRGAEMLDKDAWSGAAEVISSQKPVATVNEVSAKLADNKITVAASGYFHEDYAASGKINMIVMVLEDGFLVTQAANGADGGSIKDYPHNHVLRATIGDVWGTAIDVEPKDGQKFELPV
ncbi:MAG: Omp28-related outer membrane protein, partial [Bacteroidales bacterium]|nr:Omp28-related outer membrane protein [Bacteroidales bacterium]